MQNAPVAIRGSVGVFSQLAVALGVLLGQVFSTEQLIGKLKNMQ